MISLNSKEISRLLKVPSISRRLPLRTKVQKRGDQLPCKATCKAYEMGSAYSLKFLEYKLAHGSEKRSAPIVYLPEYCSFEKGDFQALFG